MREFFDILSGMSDSDCITTTNKGQVSGLRIENIFSFKGIPYAKRLDGLNRWLPPQEAPSFEGIHDATSFGDICPQMNAAAPKWLLSKAGGILIDSMNAEKAVQGPNCLNLNVWTPSLEPNARLPVIMFIHGGGLSLGSSQPPPLDGTAIAKKNVVYVSLNYRLGMMGFLAGDGLFKGDVLKGNRGFMDQAAALRWIQENISSFGGDPDNVTVAGQSGGGTSTWALLCSPETKGLIRRAIIMSGPINFVSLDDQLKLTRDLLKKLKVPIGDTDALAKVADKKIISAMMQKQLFKSGQPYGEMSRTKLPTTGAYNTEFLPTDILDAFKRGAAKNIDLLIGGCRHDGRASVVALPFSKKIAIRLMNKFVAGMIGATKSERKKVVNKYREIMQDSSEYEIQEQIQTDALYRIRALKAADIHSEQNGSTYVYQFDWESPVLGGAFGAMHGFDAIFALDNLELARDFIGDTAAAQSLASTISDAWVSFAKSGEPKSSTLETWPEYNLADRQTMVFNSKSKLVRDPVGEIRNIWSDD